jgi:hypothetical protein
MESDGRDESQVNVERPLLNLLGSKSRTLCVLFIDRMLLQYSVNELDFHYVSIETCFYRTIQIIIP